MNREILMFAEVIFTLMAAYVCIDSRLGAERVCVPALAAAAGSAHGAPGARCQAEQKEVSALCAGRLCWQLPPACSPALRASSEPAPELSCSLHRSPGTGAVCCHPSLPPKGSDGHFGWTVEVQRVLEQTLEAALTLCKTGTSHSPCKFLLDPKTDQGAHLLDSHVQLMAEAACCLLSPLF